MGLEYVKKDIYGGEKEYLACSDINSFAQSSLSRKQVVPIMGILMELISAQFARHLRAKELSNSHHLETFIG